MNSNVTKKTETLLAVLGPLLLREIGGHYSFSEQDLLTLLHTHIAFQQEGNVVHVQLIDEELVGHC